MLQYPYNPNCNCGLFSCSACSFQNQVFQATVGHISSDHDRACELYAQLTGTKTDYGYWHANATGHSRWGPDYSCVVVALRVRVLVRTETDSHPRTEEPWGPRTTPRKRRRCLGRRGCVERRQPHQHHRPLAGWECGFFVLLAHMSVPCN